ncbi:MAG: DUF5668 domain-containing protein [Vicinamibacterales bacterium]
MRPGSAFDRDAFRQGLHVRRERVHRAVHTRGLPHVAVGIFLTLFGFILTLDRLNVVDATQTLRWWPVGLQVLGVTLLLRRDDSQGRFWGLAWLILGSWLLLNRLGLVRVGVGDLIWPAILIVIGIRLIMRGRLRDREGRSDADTQSPHLTAVLSEARSQVAQTFTTGSLTALMGGCHLDLRRAIIEPGRGAVIDVFTVMGGHEVIVPSEWTVVLDVVTILAAAEDKRLAPLGPSSAAPSAPTVTFRGTLILGGLTVKS